MPLVRSFVLSTKNKQKTGFCPNFDPETRAISYSVVRGDSLPPKGTITKSGATCFVCKHKVPLPYVRQAGRDHRIEQALVAVVAEGVRGRAYLSPTTEQLRIATGAEPVEALDTDLPKEALGFRVQAYGLTKHRHLFTARQLRGLSTISDLISSMHEQVLGDARAAMTTEDARTLEEGGAGARAYADAVSLFLSFGLDRCADFNNALCRWSSSNEKVMNLFGRQVIPMVWDFAEANLLGSSVGAWRTCADYVCDCIEVTPIQNIPQIAGTIEQADAASGPLPGAALLVSTDPPYYDNIGYADLSDFFYVWLRRSLEKTLPGSFATLLVPKREELVANAHFFDGNDALAKEHFEEGFRSIFARIRGQLDPRFPMTVYYAFKQKDEDADDLVDEESSASGVPSVTTGWETLLNALISTDFQITATWPIRASQAWRMRSMGSNALGVCRSESCRFEAKTFVAEMF
jgi:putative DNA methylase